MASFHPVLLLLLRLGLLAHDVIGLLAVQPKFPNYRTLARLSLINIQHLVQPGGHVDAEATLFRE